MKHVIALALIVLLLPLVPGLDAALAYDRAAVLDGQLWRLVTCQLTHFGWEHALWNVGAFLALGLAVVRISPRAFAWCVGTSLLAVPMLILAQSPDLAQFRGLSGVATALFAFLAWTTIERSHGVRRTLALVVSGLLVLKLGWEASHETAVFARDASFAVVPAAHVVGALLGGLVAAIRSFDRDDLRVAWATRSTPVNPFRGRGPLGRSSRRLR